MPTVTSDGYIKPESNDSAQLMYTIFAPEDLLYHKCGALVFDKEAHDRWHEALNKRISAASMGFPILPWEEKI